MKHTSHTMKTTSREPSVITAENIENESYYNLTRLCQITGYANPIAAFKSRKAQGRLESFYVYRDANGNITRCGGCMIAPLTA